jgi:hypothetical protein
MQCGEETSEERDHVEDLGIEERIILKWIFRQLVGRS